MEKHRDIEGKEVKAMDTLRAVAHRVARCPVF